MKKIINRRASFDYQILEKFEAGVALTGQEVKSIKAGRFHLEHSFVQLKGGELWLLGANIPPYQPAMAGDYDPYRPRKLLLHKKEILNLSQKVKQRGLTIIPVSCYTKNNKIKLEIALAKGKKKFEKRKEIKKRDIQREIEKEFKERGF